MWSGGWGVEVEGKLHIRQRAKIGAADTPLSAALAQDHSFSLNAGVSHEKRHQLVCNLLHPTRLSPGFYEAVLLRDAPRSDGSVARQRYLFK